MLQIVHEFVEATKSVSDEAVLSDLFLGSIQQLGFDKFAGSAANVYSVPTGHAVVFNRYPDDWVEHYVDCKFYDIDPTVRFSLERSTPFSWSEIAARNDLTAIERSFMDEAADAGMRYGISVPVPDLKARNGCIAICGDESKMDAQAVHSVHLMSIYLYESARKMLEQRLDHVDDRQNLLTNRESECLKWASMGKTDWEIGEILGISQSTAHFHIEKAKKKFGVPTRTQAVVQAVITNQIIP